MDFEIEALDSLIPVELVGLLEPIDLQIHFGPLHHEANAGFGLVYFLLR